MTSYHKVVFYPPRIRKSRGDKPHTETSTIRGQKQGHKITAQLGQKTKGGKTQKLTKQSLGHCHQTRQNEFCDFVQTAFKSFDWTPTVSNFI